MNGWHFKWRNLKHLVLPILLALFIVFQPLPKRSAAVAKNISKVILDQQKAFNSIVGNSTLIDKCFNGSADLATLNSLQKEPFGLYFYKNDSLTFWTKNNAVLVENVQPTKSISLEKLQNGWYILFKKPLIDSEVVLGLLPIKYDFNPESDILRNEFAPLFGFNFSDVNIIPNDRQNISPDKAVLAEDGSTLFYIQKQDAQSTISVNKFHLLLFLLICFVWGLYIHAIAKYVYNRNGLAFSSVFLVLSFALFYLILHFLKPHFTIFQHKIFSSELYAEASTLPSLFNLFILSIFILWFVSFVHKRLVLHFPIDKPKWQKQLRQFILIFSVFSFSAFVAHAVKTLVLDSSISFQLFNLLSLNTFSFVGLLCVTFLLLSHFLLSSTAIKIVNGIKLPVLVFVLHCIACLLLFVLFSSLFNTAEIYISAALWSTAWLFVFLFIHQDVVTQKRTAEILIAIALYSAFSTYLFSNLFEVRERNLRKLVAEMLLQEHDYFTENNFETTYKEIEQDTTISNALSSSNIANPKSIRILKENLFSNYLARYLSKYNAAIYLSGFGSDSDYVQAKDKYFLSKSTFSKLKLCTDSSGYNSYIAMLFTNKKTPIAIEFKPRIYESENLYNRLLADNYLATKVSEEGFSYAIFRNNKLLANRGDYSYPLVWPNGLDFKGTKERFIDVGDWEHNILKGTNDRRVIITVKQESLFEPIALFSYLFTVFLLFVAIVQMLFGNYKFSFNIKSWFSPISRSFKARINYAMLSIIIISFVAIGYITVSFFSSQNNSNMSERAIKKEEAVINSLNFTLNKLNKSAQPFSEEIIVNDLKRSAYANSVDVNFFDTLGNLVYTSQPPLFERGIVSYKMNPIAYFQLKNNDKEQLNMQEQIGTFNYQSAYYQLTNKTKLTGFVVFPDYETKLKSSDEIDSFLIALMNVYVFLLLLAILIAYFISNSVTKPLNYIAQKMQMVNLGSPNQPIIWSRDDEIGVLVKQYNRMIRELENSAEQLARTEREGAWREMAKQIAHEIKNPLTPMKLSIQYLQKAINENNPRITELAAKVTQTLVEQIDNLSAIATSFSTFAKMPKGENEPVDLNNMLQGICDLFSKEENVIINYNLQVENSIVFADRNQLLSVFNNLVKNGIQSVPEEREPQINVSIIEKHEMLQVEIADNGIGIAEENYTKVFVPNFTTKSSGTGLGLAIALQIIEGSGGVIWFESEVGKGTTFFVVLPKMKA
ncbi:MAG TPA: ATP-binding protein [Chitinophagales bacterium]|nr:MAG: hypothetical protein BGO32_10555 [Bacteroidetes bacterium 37-13]HRN93148.1 ATP-binding protein [Chitinophagales bacterium]